MAPPLRGIKVLDLSRIDCILNAPCFWLTPFVSRSAKCTLKIKFKEVELHGSKRKG